MTALPSRASSNPPRTTPPKKRKPSAALVKQAEQKHAAALARTGAQGEADVSLIGRKRAQIADAFYEIGEALQRLSRAGVAQALGADTFEELCDSRLGLSLTTAAQLISIVERVQREDAVRWGQEKTAAVIELSDATPRGDRPGMLKAERLKLPNGHMVDPERDSVRALKEAAKVLRARRGDKSRRGRTTSPDERKRAARLEKPCAARASHRPRRRRWRPSRGRCRCCASTCRSIDWRR